MTTTERFVAFMEHLDSFVYLPQPPIMWPGIQSDPPDTGYCLEPKLFPNEPEDPAWDDDACARPIGFFQVKVYFRVRPDTGLVGPSTLADAIIDHFSKGTVIGDVRVKKQPHQSPVVDDDASRSFIVVTAHYTS